MVLASSRLTFGALALAAAGLALIITATALVIAGIVSASRAARSTLRLARFFRFATFVTAAWSFAHEIIVAIPLIIWVVDEFSLTGGVAFRLVTCELGIVIIIYLA